MSLGRKNPWYSDGLQFECLQCGRCCAGPEQGYIWITMPEIRLIARHLKISVRELKQKFLRRIGFRMTIVEDPHTRDCVFLSGRGCSIYDVRPAQCRNWPFWPANLASREIWISTGTRCPGINKGPLHSPEQIQSKKQNTKWWTDSAAANDNDEINEEVIERVGEIYAWLDWQLSGKAKAGQCAACGRCCDFEKYGHRLYVTTPEMIYFAAMLGRENIRQMVSAECPYQVNGRCGIHSHRFSGCRIFCCHGDAAFQSELTEAAIKKFRDICTELQIAYRYAELSAALKELLDTDNAQK